MRRDDAWTDVARSGHAPTAIPVLIEGRHKWLAAVRRLA